MSQIRIAVPKVAKAGEIIELRAMVRHKMETGLRIDEWGKKVPRDIITDFHCRLDGQTVFQAAFFPAVAANPYLSFHLKAEQSGTLEFLWTDRHGVEMRRTAVLTVS